jgi:hypothetical protein
MNIVIDSFHSSKFVVPSQYGGFEMDLLSMMVVSILV